MTPEAARMVQTPPTRAPLQVCCPTGAWERLSRARAREDQRGRMSAEGLLAALLDVSADELLGVLFQYRVDLVEQVVDILADLLMPLGDLRVRLGRRSCVDFLVLAGLAGLRLAAGVAGSHACLLEKRGEKNLPRPDGIQLEVIASSRSLALGQR